MSHVVKQATGGLGRMIVLSIICHAFLYFLLVIFHFTRLITPKEAPVYYVDVVNLPVTAPRSGLPKSSKKTSRPRKRPQMQIPAKTTAKPKKSRVPAKVMKPPPVEESAREFEERLARLEKDVNALHAAAALESIAKRIADKAQTGVVGGVGNKAGSDYARYLQSRLKDAFKTTIAYKSNKPEVLLRLTIDQYGRIIHSLIEQSSGDKVFEDAVTQAVDIAKKTFPPPPRGGMFEYGFIFRPQGVDKH